METIIRLKINKELDPITDKKILKLKGNLITLGFTDIIHINDEGLEHHINFFTIDTQKSNMVKDYLMTYIEEAFLSEKIEIMY